MHIIYFIALFFFSLIILAIILDAFLDFDRKNLHI